MGFSAKSLGGEETDVVRHREEIARRALALGAAVAISFEAEREPILSWLAESGIGTNLTERERKFIFAEKPTQEEIVAFSWRSEGLTVLLWAIGKLPELPPPNEQCSTGALVDALAPYNDQSADEFLQLPHALSDETLLATALEIQDLHALARARVRDPRRNDNGPDVDIEIIQERHHAINWVIGYCGQEWEDVTTDT